jgi:hypothetical protein
LEQLDGVVCPASNEYTDEERGDLKGGMLGLHEGGMGDGTDPFGTGFW